MFQLKPIYDHSFFDTALYTWSFDVELAASADTVWDGLTTQIPLSWCKNIKGHYISAPPYGVETKRIAKIANILNLKENFFYWNDAERRHSFYVETMNVPFFESFAEDYQVTAIEGGSRLRWRFAIEPRSGFKQFVKVNNIINELIFKSFINDTKKYFGEKK